MGRDSTLTFAMGQLDLQDYSFQEEKSMAYSGGSNGGIWRVMALNPRKIISASYDHCAKLWDVKQTPNGIELENNTVLRGHQKEVLSLAKLNNKIFITGSSDGTLCFWNSDNNALINSLRKIVKTGAYSIANINENTLAIGSCQKPNKWRGNWNHTVKIWDVKKRQETASLEGHDGGISSLVSLDEQFLVSASADHTVKVWDLKNKKMVKSFENHSDYIYGLAKFGKEHVVTASKDRTMRVFDMNAEKQIGCFENADGIAHASTVYDVNTLGSNIAASGSRDGYVRVWDFRTLKCIKTLNPDDGFVYSANFSADGKVIAGTSGKKQEGSRNNAQVVTWEFQQNN